MIELPQRPTDYQLALRALMATGLDELEARRTLELTPPLTVFGLAQRGAEAWADEETDKARAAWEASEEGRRAKAQALLAEEAERAALDAEARALLRNEAGVPDNVLDSLTHDEVVAASGIRGRTPDVSNDLDANLAAIESQEAAR